MASNKPAIRLKKNEDKRIRAGHLWIFSNEIGSVTGEPESGMIVDVFDASGSFLGSGFYNKHSLIAVRLLTNSKSLDVYQLFHERILKAYELRKQFYPERNSFRLIFSESDFLPGLIIDKFNDSYVLQIYSYGMQKNISVVLIILINELGAVNIFTRNEPHFRKMEGLAEEDVVYVGDISEEIIDDGYLKYKIDFNSSQKTGFFFDQSDNRFFIRKIVSGKKVLDAFCNSGGFGMHALAGGAKQVTFVDSSASEIGNAKSNCELNGFLSSTEFVSEDVFEYLQKMDEQNQNYDIVMIDPPAFAKSKKSIPTALKGYEKLNRLAIKIVSPGGYLVTSSCSHHIGKNEFNSSVQKAAVKNGARLQLIHSAGAAADHPRLPAMEETEYLKFSVYRVLKD